MDASKNKGLKPGRTIYKVDSPYTSVKWPQLQPTNHDVIVDMLVRLLAPIGRHRTLHVTPSKGKRSKKRKRAERPQPTPPPPPPPAPEIASHVTVGINSTTRHLEQLALSTVPAALKSDAISATETPPDSKNDSEPPATTPSPPSPITAIFIPASPNSPIHAHLPILCATASAKTTTPTASPTLLVPLKPSTEAKLATALGVPRLGVVGLLAGAPGADTLVQYVRDHVEPVDVPWLREVGAGKYLGVNVRAEGG
ncbi:hypothetical protein K490DRAFT_66710 [Saccharata proteae CBS 121410]|uniref:Uncharacterized protein n=1 Tax=Saccharata proteae CBS 121410 TaxID=1314787 RepID=A0A9P4HU12_9PEZI|nr:hypothetical protein K490DRAFT_66710 [Saccharata proteae CBS 121410]